MKKLFLITSSIALLHNHAHIQAETLLRRFENVKSDVVSSIKTEIDAVKSDWDAVIDYLDKSLYHAKTLRAAHASLEQHGEAAQALQDKLSKSTSGKTKGQLNSYKSEANSADKKADSDRKKTKDIAKRLHDHLEKSVKTAKSNHENVVKAHNDAQKAIARADEEKLHKPKTKAKKKSHKKNTKNK